MKVRQCGQTGISAAASSTLAVYTRHFQTKYRHHCSTLPLNRVSTSTQKDAGAMRSNGIGIFVLKYFRYYPLGYEVEIRAQLLLRFVGEHKWLLAECKMQNIYFFTRDKHFTEQSRIPVFRDATWRSWMSGHRRFERTLCLHFQIFWRTLEN
jgi:hypothetical protein